MGIQSEKFLHFRFLLPFQTKNRISQINFEAMSITMDKLKKLENDVGKEMEKLSRELGEVSADIIEVHRQLFEVTFNHRLKNLRVNEQRRDPNCATSENEVSPEDSRSFFFRV